MRDITGKTITLRTAKASGKVLCQPATLEMIKNKALPKGDLFNIAKAAGMLAAKNTHNLIPHCHPVAIEAMDIAYTYCEEGVVISCAAKSIGRTGIEMEVLTAVSVAALTIYDLLKPVDKQVEITEVKLLEKSGGKSDREQFTRKSHRCAVLVCSDSCAEGKREDKSGLLIKEKLEEINSNVLYYKIIKDNKEAIQEQVKEWANEDVEFVFTTGGTGLGPRDNTVAAVEEILDKTADGITEAMRAYGQARTPLAMMSRAVAGTIGCTTIVTLPGSTNGARECLEAILPALFHSRKMLKGGGH